MSDSPDSLKGIPWSPPRAATSTNPARFGDAGSDDQDVPSTTGGQWLRDPWHQGELRWHDGERWTVHLAIRSAVEPVDGDVDADVDERSRVESAREYPPYRTGMPRWAKVAVPALAVMGLVVVAAVIARSQNQPTEVVLAPPVTLNASPATASTATTEPVVAVAEPATSAVEPTTTESTSVPEVASAGPVLDPALVQACVDFTPIAAFMAIPKYQDLWSQAGLDTEVLRSNCSTMSPDELASIAADMAAVQAFFDSSAT